MAMRGGSGAGLLAALCAAGMPALGPVLVVTPGLSCDRATRTSAAWSLRLDLPSRWLLLSSSLPSLALLWKTYASSHFFPFLFV